MGSYRQLISQAKPREREPERVEPVPEKYKGVNFPYRGTQQHGVPVPDDAEYDTREFQHEMEETEIGYLPEPEEIEPYPVRIVQETSREQLDWRANRGTVGDNPVRIVDRLESRRSLTVKVLPGSAAGIYVSPQQNVKEYTGYPVAVGEKFEMRSTEEVWAISDTPGSVADYAVTYEFGVEL